MKKTEQQLVDGYKDNLCAQLKEMGETALLEKVKAAWQYEEKIIAMGPVESFDSRPSEIQAKLSQGQQYIMQADYLVFEKLKRDREEWKKQNGKKS